MTLLTQGFLKQLTELPGAPGDEGPVRDFLARTIRPLVDDLWVDHIGNLFALRRGTDLEPRRVAVLAHMDEVALFVTEIDDQGFLKVAASGGVNPRTLLGKVVQVGPEHLPGIILVPPDHFNRDPEVYRKVPEIDALVVDIGATDKENARARVKVGHRILFQTPFRLMGVDTTLHADAPLPIQGRISGKAFDDRLGCATLVALLEQAPYPFDLLAVFTTQEEVGLRGALVAGIKAQADAAFVLEGTVCDDLPGPPGEKRFPTTRLGNGPTLTQRDRSWIVHPPLLRHLLRTAQKHNIPYQFKHPNVGGTDASGFARYQGVPVAIVSTPCRYIHGPVSVADLSDFHNGIRLLSAAFADLPSLLAGETSPAALRDF
ncbi:MAG: M42 family peptidase [Caldilineae bacterium]|nr:MAG: M42 family peptidase [Caldilineae bacterium]